MKEKNFFGKNVFFQKTMLFGKKTFFLEKKLVFRKKLVFVKKKTSFFEKKFFYLWRLKVSAHKSPGTKTSRRIIGGAKTSAPNSHGLKVNSLSVANDAKAIPVLTLKQCLYKATALSRFAAH